MGRLDSLPQGQGGIQLGSWGSSSLSYSKVESSARSELDMPINFRPQQRRGKCRAVAVCVVLMLVAVAIVLGVLRGGGAKRDGSTGEDPASMDQSALDKNDLAPASSPAPSETDAPSAEDEEEPPYDEPSEEDTTPSEAAEPSEAYGPSAADAPSEAYAPSAADATIEGEHAYAPIAGIAALSLEEFCDTTSYPDTCYKTFAAIPGVEKGDLQQWTILAIHASLQVVNESFNLATQMQVMQDGNEALDQCIELQSNSLELLNATMYLVVDMNLHPSEKTDAITYMSAVMTNEDTCQEGIADVGGFQGSDKLTGELHQQISELLNIALSFTDSLATSELAPDRHR